MTTAWEVPESTPGPRTLLRPRQLSCCGVCSTRCTQRKVLVYQYVLGSEAGYREGNEVSHDVVKNTSSNNRLQGCHWLWDLFAQLVTDLAILDRLLDVPVQRGPDGISFHLEHHLVYSRMA